MIAVPGRVDSAASKGANNLIVRRHAKLVSSAEDILKELSPISAASTIFPFSPDAETCFKKINFEDLGEKQSSILKELNDGRKN